MKSGTLKLITLTTFLALLPTMAQADLLPPSPYATSVYSYTSGANAVAGYDNANVTLGAPTRAIPGDFGGDVTFFNAPWQPEHIFSIGAGGELIVAFDHQVADDPLNPFGLDLIIFGNSYFVDTSYPNGIAGAKAVEPGQIAVSQDHETWYDIAGALADDLFPTCGFKDSSGPFASDGVTPTDFTLPVDPTIDWQNKSYSQIVSLYNGSGGGTGVDISPTGLDWIQYVKVYQDSTDTWSTEIDAFADVAAVPEPLTILLLGTGALCLRRRQKRT